MLKRTSRCLLPDLRSFLVSTAQFHHTLPYNRHLNLTLSPLKSLLLSLQSVKVEIEQYFNLAQLGDLELKRSQDTHG